MKDSITLLAERRLHGPSTRIGDDLRPVDLCRAVRQLGSGLDHLSGERALALVDETPASDSPWEGSLDGARLSGLLFTDRRMLCAALPAGLYYDAVRGARAIDGGVEVLGDGASLRLETRSPAQVGGFFEELCATPPGRRAPPPRQLVEPSTGDPFGVLPTLNALPFESDARVPQLLALVPDPRVRPGVPADVAADLARRSVLFAHTVHAGRGMTEQGAWLSPLSGDDLLFAVRAILGPPQAERRAQPQEIALDFAFHEDVAKAVLSSLAGVVSASLLGVGWVRLPRTTRLSLVVRPWGSFTAFVDRAVEGDALAAREYLHELLHVFEGQLLLLRSLHGWSARPEQLFAIPPVEVADQARQLVGFSNLSAFLPDTEPTEQLDGLRPDIQAILDEVDAKSPQQRQDEARKALAEAKALNDAEAIADAALRLQHEQLYEESLAAYRFLGEEFESHRGAAARGLGDCYLFKVLYCGSPPGPEHAKDLERALTWYDSAAQAGERVESLDENYWEASKALATVAPDQARRRRALERYLAAFPRGEHASEAHRLRDA